MHEYGIAKGIIDTVLAEAEKHEAKKIKSIELLIGEFNNIVADALVLNVEMLAHGTAAQGVKLDIKRQPLRVKCAACGKQGEPKEALVFVCPFCDSMAVEITGGKALNIVSIEVE